MPDPRTTSQPDPAAQARRHAVLQKLLERAWGDERAELERAVEAGWLPPDPEGVEVAEHGLAIKRATLRDAKRAGQDLMYWRRSVARSRRAVCRAAAPSQRLPRRDRRPPGG